MKQTSVRLLNKGLRGTGLFNAPDKQMDYPAWVRDCHVVESCIMGIQTLHLPTGLIQILQAFYLFWPTASEKKLLHNKTGPSLSQSKHNSWSESLSSAIRLMPGRNTKEMTCKSEVNVAFCFFLALSLALPLMWLWGVYDASEYVCWHIPL